MIPVNRMGRGEMTGKRATHERAAGSTVSTALILSTESGIDDLFLWVHFHQLHEIDWALPAR